MPTGRIVRGSHNGVERIFGNRSAAGDGGEPASPAPLEAMIDAVAKKISAITAAAGSDTFGKHLQDGIEIYAGQIAVGIRVANQFVELVLAPFLRGASGHDLLSQNVERIGGNFQLIEIARAHAADQGSTFH